VTPVVGGLVGGVVAAICAPTLRRQYRDGEIRFPIGGPNLVRVRRDEHPVNFRLCVATIALLATGLIAATVMLLEEAFAR
jgi:hypothetical protein